MLLRSIFHLSALKLAGVLRSAGTFEEGEMVCRKGHLKKWGQKCGGSSFEKVNLVVFWNFHLKNDKKIVGKHF